jgi:CheY-like chemotaxis protein
MLVIGLTGNVMPEDVAIFKGQGADAVLTKPLDVNEFLALLEQFSKQRA